MLRGEKMISCLNFAILFVAQLDGQNTDYNFEMRSIPFRGKNIVFSYDARVRDGLLLRDQYMI